MKLKDKSAIITGAASGIGKDIALVFAREGAQVAIADLNKDAADATAARYGRRGGQAIGVAMDVTDEEQVNDGVRRRRRRSAASTSWSAMPASRSCIRSRNSATPSGRRCWRSISTARFSPRARACRTCTSRAAAAASSTWARCTRRKLDAEGAVRHRQARPDRAREGRREGRRRARRARQRDLPGFVRTPLVDKQIPEQAKALGISEEEVIKNVMLKETVDGEFTTVDDVAEAALFFAGFPDQCADRPVAGRQPRLVHAVARADFQNNEALYSASARSLPQRGSESSC